eukprot:m.47812 g.47812  ORF g.47812 m.47812 type:complete len:114 (-) comp6930_c0_seq1:134-475(-)
MQRECDNTDIIIMVSHGDFMGKLMGHVLESPTRFELMNTSVSSLKLPHDGGCIVEFVNKTDHLSVERNMQLYESMGFKERRTRSGHRYHDIAALMRRGVPFFESPVGRLLAKL